MNKNLTAIDLFCGAGGFSLGMQQTGFHIAGAVDFDPHAVNIYQTNLKHSAKEADLTKFLPADFEREFAVDRVNVVFGGPPCQGFSTARPENHGTEVRPDARRDLYQDFLRYVEYFKPELFIMENVRGITKAVQGSIFDAIRDSAESIGYRIKDYTLRAWHYGVPQKRIRHIIIGRREDLPCEPIDIPQVHNDPEDKNGKLQNPVTLWEAIGDLPCLKAGESKNCYDLKRRKKMLARCNSDYITRVLEIDKAHSLTGHSARAHSDRDLRDFRRLDEGESSASALRKGKDMEFPYNRKIFKDRYTRQHRNRLSSTILAHLAKDGLMFIHPTQTRSFTPREAARIQSFPDWFVFPEKQTHQFRLIGNAVPPLMARAIGKAVQKYLLTNCA